MLPPKKISGTPESFGWTKLPRELVENHPPDCDVWEAPNGTTYACDAGTKPEVTVWRIGVFTSPPILGEEW